MNTINKNNKNLDSTIQKLMQGFCDEKTMNIKGCFLKIMPQILRYYKHHFQSIPDELYLEYYKQNQDKTEMTEEDFMAENFKNQDDVRFIDNANDWACYRWTKILEKMIFLFEECDNEKCSHKNQFNKEYKKLEQEFNKKYAKEIEQEKQKKGFLDKYLILNWKEYDEIRDLSFKEYLKIEAYKEECKKEALNMFVKYFDDLC